MGGPKECIVAGFPIEHSLSPHLFSLVHEHLGLPWKETKKVLTSELKNIFTNNENQKFSKKYQLMIKKVTKEVKGENLVGRPPYSYRWNVK